MESTADNPFSFWISFLEKVEQFNIYKDWVAFKKEFIEHQGDFYSIEFDEINKSVKCTEIDNLGCQVDSIYKYGYFGASSKRLIEEIKNTIDIIDITFAKNKDNPKKSREYYSLLEKKFTRLKRTDACKDFFVLKGYFSKIEECLFQYRFVSRKTETEIKITSNFISRKIRVTFLKKLYDLSKTASMDIINTELTNEEQFIEAFNSSGDGLIYFNKNNQIVAYYLRELETFFDNLNYSTVGKSGVFFKQLFNNKREPFNPTSLYTSHSLFKKRKSQHPYKAKIDELIVILKKSKVI